MKLKHLFAITCTILLFACAKTSTTQVKITGEITNPIGENVAFSNQDTSYSTTANEDGTFSISFILDSAIYLNFGHGVETTAMFVKPDDKIHLTIDTELFDETIQYEGSMKSSFLAKKYLITEENDFFGEVFYLSTTEEYSKVLEDFKTTMLVELLDGVDGLSDSLFIKMKFQKLINALPILLEGKKN